MDSNDKEILKLLKTKHIRWLSGFEAALDFQLNRFWQRESNIYSRIGMVLALDGVCISLMFREVLTGTLCDPVWTILGMIFLFLSLMICSVAIIPPTRASLSFDYPNLERHYKDLVDPESTNYYSAKDVETLKQFICLDKLAVYRSSVPINSRLSTMLSFAIILLFLGLIVVLMGYIWEKGGDYSVVYTVLLISALIAFIFFVMKRNSLK